MTSAIETFHLGKRFGSVCAVDDLTLSVAQGSVVGLLGPNGSGKTVTMRLLAGLIKPTSGEFAVFGRLNPYHDTSTRALIGYISQTLEFPQGLTVESTLGLCRSLYPSWNEDLQSDLVKRFELPLSRTTTELSLGIKLRLALACALCQRAKILLLDEPSGNLDPVIRTEFFQIMADVLAMESPAVLLATHVFSDLERIVERFIILNLGREHYSDSIDNLCERYRRVQVIFSDSVPIGFSLKNTIREKSSRRIHEAVVFPYVEEAVARSCAEAGGSFDAFPISLEELFVELCGRGKRP